MSFAHFLYGTITHVQAWERHRDPKQFTEGKLKWPCRSHAVQRHWVFLLKTTWMSFLSLFVRCSAESFTLISRNFDQSFHRHANRFISPIKPGEMQDSQGCCLCALPAPLLAVHQISSTVHSHHQSRGKLRCLCWFRLHSSWPKYFLNHHTLRNADKKQAAASSGLEWVICPVDFTSFFFRHLTYTLKKYTL